MLQDSDSGRKEKVELSDDFESSDESDIEVRLFSVIYLTTVIE